MHDSYPQIYKRIWGKDIDVTDILMDFAKLPLPDPANPIVSAGPADKFFEKYGVGNTLSVVDRPYERMYGYELLLKQLYDHDKDRFQAIHKGTPYFFLSWTAFQLENFEKGIFYLDQSVSEDIRKDLHRDINILKTNPGIGCLLLDPSAQSGIGIAQELFHAVEDEIQNFSRTTTLPLNNSKFVDKFILDSGNFFQNEFRTLITSIYSFILEYKKLQTQLEIRSVAGGSLEPFFLHLFKGGLILESLLKLKNPGTSNTLGRVLNDYATHGNKLQIDTTTRVLKGGTLADVIAHYNQLLSRREVYQNLCFAAAYGIRNTTGHNLTWNDIFQRNENAYGLLYASILDSIFWTIYKLWIE